MRHISSDGETNKQALYTIPINTFDYTTNEIGVGNDMEETDKNSVSHCTRSSYIIYYY